MNLYPAFFHLLLFFASGCIFAHAQGRAIGIDFGHVEGEPLHWNTIQEPRNVRIDKLVDTSGSVVHGVAFEVSLPEQAVQKGKTYGVGQNAVPATSTQFPAMPTAAQEDWWFENHSELNAGYTFKFTGLDDSKTYELTIGAYRPDAIGEQIENGSTAWVLSGSRLTTRVDDASGAYVTFRGLRPSAGKLTVRNVDYNGNWVSAVSALKLVELEDHVEIPEPHSFALFVASLGLSVVFFRRGRVRY